MKVAITKEDGMFSLNAVEIKSVADVKEIIHQCQLVKSQISGESNENISFVRGLLIHNSVEAK